MHRRLSNEKKATAKMNLDNTNMCTEFKDLDEGSSQTSMDTECLYYQGLKLHTCGVHIGQDKVEERNSKPFS